MRAVQRVRNAQLRAGGLPELLAADAGTSATVVLHHFGSKQKLLMAVLQAREEANAERVHNDFDRDDVREQFRAILRPAEYNLTQPGLIQLFSRLAVAAGDPHHPAHEYFSERYRVAAEALAAALGRFFPIIGSLVWPCR